MVRINCGIPPVYLADQHLVAEYREILLVFGYYDKNDHKPMKLTNQNLKHPIRFYNDKRRYLIKRFYELKQEMIDRGMRPIKDIKLNGGKIILYKDFKPQELHINRIKNRIMERLKAKPGWYRYCGTYQPPEFFKELMFLND